MPFTAIGAVLIGGGYYYPDAYVGLRPALLQRPHAGRLPASTGSRSTSRTAAATGNACSSARARARCRRRRRPRCVAPPPVPQGSCEVTIYSDPNFGGTGVTTGEEQPALSQSGWQNQIASIQVKSGTWDFFTDENFAGAPMRLQPGPYQDLGPEWTKKIGSFMCVQPGQLSGDKS